MALFAMTAAAPAHAHLLQTGFGPFYDGLTHFFLTPEDLLPVFALAAFAGLRGARFGRLVLFTLPLAWLAGSALGLLLLPFDTFPVVTALVTILLGLLAVADRPLPVGVVIGLAIGLGLLNGGMNGAELTRASAPALVALGTASSIFVVVALLAGQVASVRATWARIAVRAAASWIAATGVFMVGWSLRAR